MFHVKDKGYTYLEVLVALLVFAIALLPAMDAIQSSLRGVRQEARTDAETGERDVSDGQAVVNKMERLLALTTATLSTAPSGKDTAHATHSDAAGAKPRCLVYTSWYKPEAVLEADRFVSANTSKLLWVKVEIEDGGTSAAALVFVP